jgi:NADPH-dependent 2,4-dienoyl-CoA reductase/sulfur reductase-like enzyme/nitrite reductase/ring-hydroxylating ferredoxin subunit
MPGKRITVAKIHELHDGDMKSVTTDDGQTVLLIRTGNEYKAFGGHCSHYGAPLADGVHSDERIVCPWHHAAFDIASGDILEGPALDHLEVYPVSVAGEDIIIELPERITGTRPAVRARKNSGGNGRTVVIVGAGAAGYAAADALRQNKYRGRIVMISEEKDPPYDRPNLSKGFLSGEYGDESMPLRNEKFYDEGDIELLLDTTITKVDVSRKIAATKTGATIAFDTILLATGGRPRVPDLPGIQLGNIFTLRSYADARAILAAAKNADRAAVIGAGFIGTETAYALSKHNIKVNLIAPEEVPFERILGREIGGIFQTAHAEYGAQMLMGQTVERFEGRGKVEKVILKNGDEIEVDMVVLGIGITPVTDYINGLSLNDDGSVPVDKHLRAAPDVYAAGDIARFPYWYSGDNIRIEHWRTALQHGHVAGCNMAGVSTEYKSVPFFWTEQAGLVLQYVGYAPAWEEIIVDGQIAEKNFMAYFINKGKVHAVAGMGRDRQMAAVQEVMRMNKFPVPDQLKSGSFDFVRLLQSSVVGKG